MGAREHLRASQDDRLRRPKGSLRRADLEADLLAPLLDASIAVAAPIGERIFGSLAAPRQPLLPTLAVTIDELLAPPLPRDVGEDEPQPEFGDEPIPWWERYWTAAEELLDGVAEPTHLARLVAQARAVADAADDEEGRRLDPDLLVGAVCHLAHGLLATALTDAGPVVLLAVPTGTRVADRAIDADDLLVVPAAVIDPAAPVHVPPLDLSVAD
jgi:hypothetical protein